MAEIETLTIKIDGKAVATLHDRIAALGGVVTEEEAGALSDYADDLSGQGELFFLTLEKGSGVAVMEANPNLLARVAELEAKYGL